MRTPHIPSGSRGDGNTADAVDVRTDDGLRHVLDAHAGLAWWDTALGTALLAEIRRRAVRNAAHIASSADVAANRDLVDDVVAAAWIVLRQHGGKIASAARPLAYLMSSAQGVALAEVRAQQLLTNAASIRGRAREVLPRMVRLVGSAPAELAVAFRHEPSGELGDTGRAQVSCQVRRHEQTPLQTPSSSPENHLRQRKSWFVAFVDMLVSHGADREITIAAVERLADVFGVTGAGRWEWAARRDPVLARLGLSPDHAVRWSRSSRVPAASDVAAAAMVCCLGHLLPARSADVGLSPVQQQRIAVYVAAPNSDVSERQPAD